MKNEMTARQATIKKSKRGVNNLIEDLEKKIYLMEQKKMEIETNLPYFNAILVEQKAVKSQLENMEHVIEEVKPLMINDGYYTSSGYLQDDNDTALREFNDLLRS